jgi:hypothetical protein
MTKWQYMENEIHSVVFYLSKGGSVLAGIMLDNNRDLRGMNSCN